MDALVFDDDLALSEIISEVLSDAGFEVKAFSSGVGALDAVRSLRPRLVVLDIMMPGMDGLSILKALRADPETRRVKVVIATAKRSVDDEQAAISLGADALLRKPFSMENLGSVLIPLVRQGADRSAELRPTFLARVLGCWSAGAKDRPTSAVLLNSPEAVVFLDAGTGLHSLDSSALANLKECWLMLTHFHADHLDGIPAFSRLPNLQKIKVVGPRDAMRDLKEEVRSRASAGFGSRFEFHAVGEGSFSLAPGYSCSSLLTMHPGSTLAYRFDLRGRSLVYCPDNELELPPAPPSDFTAKIARFVRGTDLLIHDARVQDADYEKVRGQGHSSPSGALSLAREGGVSRLLLFHADSQYQPADLESSLKGLTATAGEKGPKVLWAKPGLELAL